MPLWSTERRTCLVQFQAFVYVILQPHLAVDLLPQLVYQRVPRHIDGNRLCIPIIWNINKEPEWFLRDSYNVDPIIFIEWSLGKVTRELM